MLVGDEPFHDGGAPLPFMVSDFWRWGVANLTGNALRGILAEFLVARALGVASGARVEGTRSTCVPSMVSPLRSSVPATSRRGSTRRRPDRHSISLRSAAGALSGVVGALGAIGPLGPLVSVVSGVITVGASFWTGTLPRPLADVKWLQWAIKWDVEEQGSIESRLTL